MADTENKTPVQMANAAVDELYDFRDQYFEKFGLEKAVQKNDDVKKKMEETVAVVEPMKDTIPNKAAYFVLMGRVYNVTPDYDSRAEDFLSKAVKLDPKLVEAWNHLGELFWKKGDVNNAKNCFTGALNHSRNKVSLRNLSMVLRQLNVSAEEKNKNVEESVEKAKEAVQLDITDGLSWLILGNAYLSLFFISGQNPKILTQAMSAYKQAEKDPVTKNNPDLHYNRSSALQFQEDFQSALQGYSRATLLDPSWHGPLTQETKLLTYLANITDLIEAKGKVKGKRLQSLAQSPRDSALGPFAGGGYTSASGKSVKLMRCSFRDLEPELNAERVILGKVVCTVPTEDLVPFTFCMLDEDETCLPVSVYNIAQGTGVKIGDSVAIPEPYLQHVKVLHKGKHVGFSTASEGLTQRKGKRYPSVIQQEFRLLFHGPITEHQEEVITFLSIAISEHLEKKKLCSQQVCQIGNLTVPCDPSRAPSSDPGSEVNNNSCFEDIESEKFFITFNVTLKNTTSPAELDMGKLLQEIQRELLSLTSLLQLQLEDHLFTAISDSLSTNEVTWSCPLGQIPENNICIACPPGTMHNVTLDICQYCNMGQFQEKEGQVTCDYCGPGKTSPGGATTSTQCHTIPSMDEMTLFVIVTACSFGVVFLCMAITLYLQFQRQQKRNQKASSQKKTRYNMTPNIYVAPPPILKSKLDENLSPGQRTYSIDKKHPINIYNNHDYEDPDRSPMSAPTSVFQNEMFNGSPGQVRRATNRDYSPMEEVPTGTLSRENTFNNSTYSPLFSVKRTERGSQKGSPIPQRKMSHDSSFSSYSPGMMRTQGTPTSDTPLITQSPLLRLKLAAYNLNQED